MISRMALFACIISVEGLDGVRAEGDMTMLQLAWLLPKIPN